MTCPQCAFANPPAMAFCGRCGATGVDLEAQPVRNANRLKEATRAARGRRASDRGALISEVSIVDLLG